MESFNATRYILHNVATGREFEDTGWLLDDPEGESPSLIRARYAHKQIHPKEDRYGLYRFADWLPIVRMLKGSSAPVTYKSQKFQQVFR